jgi:hypothetical protein
MTALSNALENALINHLLRNSQHTTPGTNVWIALYTDSQGEADSGTEVSGNGYARIQVTGWDAPSNGATANTAEIDFGTASGGNWGTITSVDIRDSSTSSGTDNPLLYGDLDSPKVVNDGDGFKFAAGDLDVTLA